MIFSFALKRFHKTCIQKREQDVGCIKYDSLNTQVKKLYLFQMSNSYDYLLSINLKLDPQKKQLHKLKKEISFFSNLCKTLKNIHFYIDL